MEQMPHEVFMKDHLAFWKECSRINSKKNKTRIEEWRDRE